MSGSLILAEASRSQVQTILLGYLVGGAFVALVSFGRQTIGDTLGEARCGMRWRAALLVLILTAAASLCWPLFFADWLLRRQRRAALASKTSWELDTGHGPRQSGINLEACPGKLLTLPLWDARLDWSESLDPHSFCQRGLFQFCTWNHAGVSECRIFVLKECVVLTQLPSASARFEFKCSSPAKSQCACHKRIRAGRDWQRCHDRAKLPVVSFHRAP